VSHRVVYKFNVYRIGKMTTCSVPILLRVGLGIGNRMNANCAVMWITTLYAQIRASGLILLLLDSCAKRSERIIYFQGINAETFYHAMHYSAKHGLAIACRLSVCLSVCDVGGSGPHRLKILETNCVNNQPNVFTLCNPPTSRETWRNFGEKMFIQRLRS